MTRGFLYAGATTVVASLWQVADEATLALMERFYANLGRMNKRDAMRAAQLDVARKIPQPYFWAAFYVTGSSG
jgi:CHAT domain-containing protein